MHMAHIFITLQSPTKLSKCRQLAQCVCETQYPAALRFVLRSLAIASQNHWFPLKTNRLGFLRTPTKHRSQKTTPGPWWSAKSWRPIGQRTTRRLDMFHWFLGPSNLSNGCVCKLAFWFPFQRTPRVASLKHRQTDPEKQRCCEACLTAMARVNPASNTATARAGRRWRI